MRGTLQSKTRGTHLGRKLNVMMMTDVTGRGGAEKALVDLALRLRRDSYNVTVCATRYTGNYQSLLDAGGISTISLDRHTRREAYKMVGLLGVMRQQPVHILHTHLFGSNTWGRILGKVARVPVIIAHEHWSSKSSREVWVDRLLYRLSDRILVPSRASKRMVMQMERIPASYLDVLYNGVDISEFAPRDDAAEIKRELGFAHGSTVIGTVGRLSPEKGGVDVLVRAVARLRGRDLRAHLLVVGDGPLRTGLERLAGDLGMLESGAAVFTGTRPDVARLLAAMDVFVLPSLKEALPIALLEAMAVRLPVVASRVGGIPEVVSDGDQGILIPPGNEQALYNALERLLSTPALAAQMGLAGQAHVHSNFTVDEMIKKVEGLYRELAESKGLVRR